MADTETLAELLAERDRLRRVTELQAATIEQQADSIQKIMEQSARRKEFADRLRAQVDAAPDLLEALRECMADADEYERRSGKKLVNRWPDKARAALAKALPLNARANLTDTAR